MHTLCKKVILDRLPRAVIRQGNNEIAWNAKSSEIVLWANKLEFAVRVIF